MIGFEIFILTPEVVRPAHSSTNSKIGTSRKADVVSERRPRDPPLSARRAVRRRPLRFQAPAGLHEAHTESVSRPAPLIWLARTG
eukprot:scaffold48_cov311-Pinguiococcus_pyrenoidosus.AAC.96